MQPLIAGEEQLDSFLHLNSSNLSTLLERTISGVGVLTLGATGRAEDVIAILILSIIHGDEWINQILVISLFAFAGRDTLGNTATDGFLTLG